MFPQIDLARAAIYGVLFAAVIALAELHGYSRGEQKLFEAQAAAAVKGAKVMQARQVVTERVVLKYIKVREAAQVIEKTIEKEVVRYAEKNPGACLDAEWGGLHDAAAKNIVPDATGGVHAAGGAPKAATVIGTVTENYAKHHSCADRLDGLQAWVSAQLKVKEE